MILLPFVPRPMPLADAMAKLRDSGARTMRLERAAGCARVLRWGLVVVATTVSTAGVFGSVAAQTSQDVQRTAEQVIRRLDLQTVLPSGPEPKFFSLKLPPELLWVVIAIAVGVLLYTFRDFL